MTSDWKQTQSRLNLYEKITNGCVGLRNKITQEKRDSKKSHYASYFEKNKKKSSDIWKGIRSLVNIKPAKTSNIKLMDENKNLISDPQKIANIFNDHFSTIKG